MQKKDIHAVLSYNAFCFEPPKLIHLKRLPLPSIFSCEQTILGLSKFALKNK
jgi:hypothetical protein